MRAFCCYNHCACYILARQAALPTEHNETEHKEPTYSSQEIDTNRAGGNDDLGGGICVVGGAPLLGR